MEAQVLEIAKRSPDVDNVARQDEPFGEDELESVRKGLPNGKATGVDGLPNEVLKARGGGYGGLHQSTFQLDPQG